MKIRGLFVLVFIAVLIIGVSAFSFNSNIFAKKGELKVTLEHPFLVNGNWIKASQLKVGDELFTIDGKKARITSIKDVNESVDVYNLEVEKYSDFVLSDGIVVHNSNLVSIQRLDTFETNQPIIEAGKGRGSSLEEIVNKDIPIGANIKVKRGISDIEAERLKEQIISNHLDWDFNQVREELKKYGADYRTSSLQSSDINVGVEGSGYAHTYVGHGPPASIKTLPDQALYFNTEEEFQRTLSTGISNPDLSFISRGNRVNYRIDINSEFGTQFITTVLDSNTGRLITHYRQPNSEVITQIWDSVNKGQISGAEIFVSAGATKDKGTVFMKLPLPNGGFIYLNAVKNPGVPAQVSFVKEMTPQGLTPVSKLSNSPSQMLSSTKSNGMVVDLDSFK